MLYRREALLRLGRIGLGAVTLPQLLRSEAQRRTLGAEAPAIVNATGGRAKSCILIYLWGGPPQQDMWDMKPEAPEGIRSQFQ